MERGEEPTSFTPYGGGVGGKVRKPTTRKPPVTPYARPVQNQSQKRWLSKLVDPAYRLIAGGATRLLPSLFSKSLLSNALPSSSDGDHDKVGAEDEDNASGEDELCNINLRTSTVAGFPGPSGDTNRLENSSDFNGHLKDRDNHSLAGTGNFDIEELIKEKTFSRDDVNRLVEIIKSRALEPSNKVEDKKFPPLTIEKQAEQPAAANKLLNMAHEKKQEDLDIVIGGNTTPHLQSIVSKQKVNEVSASPVEIARAYMSNRKSETGLLSDKMTSNDDRALLHDDEHMLKPCIPSFPPTPSPCWPGAMSERYRGYATPRSQRGSFGLHNFPRTPYSRSIYSKSKSKVVQLTQLQGDAQKSVNTSSPLWKQSQTPAYDQVKSTNHPLDGATGSIGPIRRLRHKAAAVTPSRGSAYFYPTGQPETKGESSNTSKGTLLDTKKNLEPGGSSSIPQVHSVGNNKSVSSLSAVHLQSSQVARSILEHISRNPPTPKEKNEELKRAIAWKKTPSSGVHSVKPNETNSFASVFDSREKVNQIDQNCHPQQSDEGKSVSVIPSKASVGRDSDAVNNNSSGMMFGLTNADFLKHRDDGGLKVNNTSKEIPKIVPTLGSEVGSQIKPSPSVGTKPTFPSITINKNESRWGFSSDSSSSGFTFPVSAAYSGLLSEPPTPSILPSITTGSNQHLLKDETAIPSYSFGLKKSSPALVFSFSSTNSDTVCNDTLNIKFSFGSDEHTRLSFISVGKDAVCY